MPGRAWPGTVFCEVECVIMLLVLSAFAHPLLPVLVNGQDVGLACIDAQAKTSSKLVHPLHHKRKLVPDCWKAAIWSAETVFMGTLTCAAYYIIDINLTLPTIKPVLPCNAWGFGSSPGRRSGRTKVSKPSVAGLLLCSQVVHRRQEARQGR